MRDQKFCSDVDRCGYEGSGMCTVTFLGFAAQGNGLSLKVLVQVRLVSELKKTICQVVFCMQL